ncbi:unnamed protein product [Clavelina lepadiformis]|uniref:Vacuolar protein sorting-associated protein 72 homolog n=1 Tax=Clavelina lepadiformis TaxID=159417 RepID=A0ABP0GSP4_CLALP
MAASREHRRNAGNRMSRVLEGELDEDDFYKTTYGGFAEEEEDNDFQSDQEDSGDEVDSDFDQSEHDELISDGEDVDKPKRRKKGVSTKAYKEPVIKKPVKKPDEKPIASDKVEEDKTTAEAQPTKKRTAETALEGPMRKSCRKSTAANSMLTVMRQKEREETDKKKKETAKKPTAGVRRLTQEELMAVAEKTERKNLKSLENYKKLEASRKKVAIKKRTFDEPTITYFSTAMPKVNILEPDEITGIKKFNNDDKASRSFLVFSHESTFRETFRHKRLRPPPKACCPVTKKLARYIDPLTKLPYYDLNAFKQIREAYHTTIKELKTKTAK